MMFYQDVKALRLSKRLTLREFCEKVGLDPSNWSKVERGIHPPPGDLETLERLAECFGLEGAKKLEFMDSAALQRREIPQDVAESELLQRTLPAFFRAARGHELDEAELRAFADDLIKLHRADKPRG